MDTPVIEGLGHTGLQQLHNHIGRLVVVGAEENLCVRSRREQWRSAQDIQTQLLPNRYPHTPGYTIQACSTLATEPGGDHYNFHWVCSDHLGILIADVSGKGMHAALMAVMLASNFRIQTWGNKDVRDVLARINDFMTTALRQGSFITCTYGILELSTRRFTWARAGHEPLLIAHADGSIESLAPAGCPLGILDSSEFRDMLEVHTVQLEAGDRILLYTDGLTEAMSGDSEEFGQKRILDALVPAPVGDALANLEAAVGNHVHDTPLHDDLTIVCLAVE